MYRKLMFLISLVALLVLANGTFAADITWDGGGVGDSVGTPENWDGDALPAPGDRARMEYRTDGENTAVADCVFTVGDLRMPAHGGSGDGATILNIVSGGVVTANGGRAGDDDSDIGELHLSGTGSLTVNGEYRFFDDGSQGWLTIADNALMVINNNFSSSYNSWLIFIFRIFNTNFIYT